MIICLTKFWKFSSSVVFQQTSSKQLSCDNKVLVSKGNAAHSHRSQFHQWQKKRRFSVKCRWVECRQNWWHWVKSLMCRMMSYIVWQVLKSVFVERSFCKWLQILTRVYVLWQAGILTTILTVSVSFVPSVLWRCWLGMKGIRPVKNRVVGYWRGYLSGARCSLAYGPADATVTHSLLLQ